MRTLSPAVSLSLLILLTCGSATAQLRRRADPQSTGERLVAVVPIVGSGSYSDPKRALFVPLTAKEKADSGLVSYISRPSDDKRYLVVEFVGRNRAALLAIQRDPRVIAAFEKGKSKKEDVEKELRKYIKDWKVDDREDRKANPGGGK